MSERGESADLSERLIALLLHACSAGKVGANTLAAAIGVRLAPGARGYAEVEPLPAGILQMTFGLEHEGGPVRFVDVHLQDDAVLALADLATVLADGREQPPRHPGDPDRVLYDLRGPGAGCKVAVDLRPAAPAGDRLVAGLSLVL